MMPGALVGRDAELARARGFLDGIAVEPGALLVEGEPGIGKTTVWAAAITEAESRGIRVLQARAAETEVQLSYAALADLPGRPSPRFSSAPSLLRSCARRPTSRCSSARSRLPS
jgi:hypothetical protein